MDSAIFFTNLVDHIIFDVLGTLLAVYALHVELQKEKNPNYVALCDINDKMNCSKVLTSEYSKGFGFVHYLVGKENFLNQRNCNLGILFYSVQIILRMFLAHLYWARMLLVISSVVSCIGSIYLAFILFYVLNDVCIVCISTYVVNFALMYLNYKLYYMY